MNRRDVLVSGAALVAGGAVLLRDGAATAAPADGRFSPV